MHFTRLHTDHPVCLSGGGGAQAQMAAGQALRQLLQLCNPQRALLCVVGALPRERDIHRKGQLPGERLVAAMEAVRALAPRWVAGRRRPSVGYLLCHACPGVCAMRASGRRACTEFRGDNVQ